LGEDENGRTLFWSADPHGCSALAGLRLLAELKTAESKIDSALQLAFFPFTSAIF
jgi:hypothetical protein